MKTIKIILILLVGIIAGCDKDDKHCGNQFTSWTFLSQSVIFPPDKDCPKDEK